MTTVGNQSSTLRVPRPHILNPPKLAQRAKEGRGVVHGNSLAHHHRLRCRHHREIPAPRPDEPAGFILTTLLGIAGAFVATYLGQALGWYHADEGAGLIGAVVGAIIVLVVWGFFAPRSPAT